LDVVVTAVLELHAGRILDFRLYVVNGVGRLDDLISRVSLFGKGLDEDLQLTMEMEDEMKGRNVVAQYGHPRAAGGSDEIQDLAQ
jgi:hypothetical protein